MGLQQIVEQYREEKICAELERQAPQFADELLRKSGELGLEAFYIPLGRRPWGISHERFLDIAHRTVLGELATRGITDVSYDKQAALQANVQGVEIIEGFPDPIFKKSLALVFEPIS